MKKFLMFLFVLFAAVTVSASCYAQITEADLNIGGIYYGQPAADVIKKLGQPIRREITPPAGSAPVFRYGNAEILVKYNDNHPAVWGVRIISGNGLYTAAGIGSGSTYDEVIKAYGKADIDTTITNPQHNYQYIEYRIPKGNRGYAYLSFSLTLDKKVESIRFDEAEDFY